MIIQTGEKHHAPEAGKAVMASGHVAATRLQVETDWPVCQGLRAGLLLWTRRGQGLGQQGPAWLKAPCLFRAVRLSTGQ